MTKKQITVKLDTEYTYLNEPLTELIKHFTKLIDIYGDTVHVDEDWEHGEYRRMFYIRREETDEEYNKRLQNEEKTNKYNQELRKKQFEILKKEFGE